MGTMKVDLSKASGSLGNFPDGPVVGTILKAEMQISKAGNDMLVVDWEVYHPRVGTGEVRDWLVGEGFESKFKMFWIGIMNMNDADSKDLGEIEVDDTLLAKTQAILHIGHIPAKEGYAARQGLVDPYYSPLRLSGQLLKYGQFTPDGRPIERDEKTQQQPDLGHQAPF